LPKSLAAKSGDRALLTLPGVAINMHEIGFLAILRSSVLALPAVSLMDWPPA
jgi:hypothetical protein